MTKYWDAREERAHVRALYRIISCNNGQYMTDMLQSVEFFIYFFKDRCYFNLNTGHWTMSCWVVSVTC